MRVQLFRFAGFPAGQTDFAVVAGIPGTPVFEFDTALQTIGKAVGGTENGRSTITIVGHADRQDRSDFNCDQRRESEINASRERALSAWEWIKPVVKQYAEERGWLGGDWWEESDRVTWDLVFAATGMLLNGSANDTERAENRRVDILVSNFPI